MYENFYGLSELPFELTANPKFLYLSPAQREALSTIQYGLSSAKALTLVVGEVGTGKTTLIQAALESERCRAIRCVYLNNPTLRIDDFVRLLAQKFELGRDAGESKAVLLEQLEMQLRERRAASVVTALVVDEAQSVSFEILEEIRLLANIETPEFKLLPVVLCGQPELASRLEDRSLRQLKQRVGLRAVLQPFDFEETGAYIATRVVTAGGTPGRMFSLEAVALIHELSGGIARTINVICDNALLAGMALGRQLIDRATIIEVSHDLQLTPGSLVLPKPPASSPAVVSDTAVPQPPDPAKREQPRAVVSAHTPRVGRTIT